MTPQTPVLSLDAGDDGSTGKALGEGAKPVEPVVYNLRLSFSRPPLMSNDRKHWTVRAKVTRQIHEEIAWQALIGHVPSLTRPTVALHWIPAQQRRRDADGPIPTAKAALDGLVVCGLLEDDTTTHVDHRMPVIHPPLSGKGICRLWLEVTG